MNPCPTVADCQVKDTATHCQNQRLWHAVGMKQFLGLVLLLIVLSGVAHAQQDADTRYVAIYTIIQQADNLAEGGQPKDALVAYGEAKSKLERFQKLFPNWDPGIVSYRME